MRKERCFIKLGIFICTYQLLYVLKNVTYSKHVTQDSVTKKHTDYVYIIDNA